MISGVHIVVFSRDAEADRAFFRDVLGFPHVDAGQGWLIFALPPAEAAVHPTEGREAHQLYLQCDNLKAELARLQGQGIECADVQEAPWGNVTYIRLPGGGQIGLYEPKHPTAFASGRS